MIYHSAKILIVEDDIFVAMAVDDFLADAGFTDVTVATSYVDALRIVNDQSFSICIFDLNLAGRMSDELIAIAKSKSSKIIITTGYQCRAEFIAYDLFLDKPVSDQKLLSSILQLI